MKIPLSALPVVLGGIVVGIIVAPIVVSAYAAAANSTGSAVTLYHLFPVIWALFVVAIFVGGLMAYYSGGDK